MGKITHNEMTKQNARTAIFTLSERTSETEKRLDKENAAMHCDAWFKYTMCTYLHTCVSDERLFPAHASPSRPHYITLHSAHC